MCVNKLHKLSAVETCLSELGKNLGLFQLNYKGALKMTNEQTAKCKNWKEFHGGMPQINQLGIIIGNSLGN